MAGQNHKSVEENPFPAPAWNMILSRHDSVNITPRALPQSTSFSSCKRPARKLEQESTEETEEKTEFVSAVWPDTRTREFCVNRTIL